MLKIFKKSAAVIPDISRLLMNGAIVALPTETAYGLAADATKPTVVNKLVRAKGRSSNKPIALMVGDIRIVRRYFYLTGNSKKLAAKFWPGPLTLLLVPKYRFPKKIIGSGNLVGVRIPGDRWLQQILLTLGKPLTATSANAANKPTPYSSTEVRKFIKKTEIKYLVDAGRLPIRPTSTVVRVNNDKIEIIRAGAISVKRIKSVIR